MSIVKVVCSYQNSHAHLIVLNSLKVHQGFRVYFCFRLIINHLNLHQIIPYLWRVLCYNWRNDGWNALLTPAAAKNLKSLSLQFLQSWLYPCDGLYLLIQNIRKRVLEGLKQKLTGWIFLKIRNVIGIIAGVLKYKSN